jgi:hypothetical protein
MTVVAHKGGELNRYRPRRAAADDQRGSWWASCTDETASHVADCVHGVGSPFCVSRRVRSTCSAMAVSMLRLPVLPGAPDPVGRVRRSEALAFGITLAATSIVVMGVTVDAAAAAPLACVKRRTAQNIVFGGAAGAFPPVIGWVASTRSWRRSIIFGSAHSVRSYKHAEMDFRRDRLSDAIPSL